MQHTDFNTIEDARQQRGFVIAALMKLKKRGDEWIVPSQTHNGDTYRVNLTNSTCTCPDHETRRVKCKHIWAVEITITRETKGVVTKVKRMTYRQDWTAYNKAQTTEKATFMALLADLCRSVKQPPQTVGRPALLLSDRVFAATLKVYSTISARRFMSDLADAKAKGLVSYLPHFNAVFKTLDDPTLTQVLRELIETSSLPLKAVETDFAVDSTAFTTSQFVRWYDQKYGKARTDYRWLKAHVICGVKTNIITSAEISPGNENDSPFLPPLVEATAQHFEMAEVSADKGYISKRNLAAITKVGADPYIPFKTNVVPPDPSTLWGKMFYFYHLHRDTFLEHYHKRSNAETTFSMVKAKFGSAVRSKTEPAQTNEVLLKLLCHNLCVVVQSMHELGVEPDFGTGIVEEKVFQPRPRLRIVK